jgi:hypothetical protein
MEIRPVRHDEYGRLGDITVAAYRAIDADSLDDGYAGELRDWTVSRSPDSGCGASACRSTAADRNG